MLRICRRALLAAAMVALPSAASAQAAKPGAAKGVWEAVNYSEDLTLTDAFFVTPDVGWVTGDKGTILHTRDGGTTWTPQLGGDPASPDPKIDRLRFYDERHGWAVQGQKLLRTTDGENWEETGALPYAFKDYRFVSPTDGFASATPASQGNADHIFRTRDGGGTWEVVAPCKAKVVIDGTTRELGCTVDRFHFPSRRVGYFVASQFWLNTQRWPPIIGKTEDGGETWEFMAGPGDPKEAMLQDLAFTDEQNGVVYAVGEVGLQKFYVTSDGGRTWKSTVASPPSYPRFYFADPEVGWSIGPDKLLYTTNGGKRWTSVAQRFPSYEIGVSFPRRDRAYVVGDHGMVLRYRVLAPGEKTLANAKPAPAMPSYATPLEEEAAEALALIESLQPDGAAAAGETVAAEDNAESTEPSDESTIAAEEGETVAPPAEETGDEEVAGTGEVDVTGNTSLVPIAPAKLSKLDLLVTALGNTVPSFLDQFTNLNLLAARLRSTGELPNRLTELKAAVASVKQAEDKSAADAAVARALAAAQGFYAAAAVATQRQIAAQHGGPEPGAPGSAEEPVEAAEAETEEVEESEE